MVFDNNRRAREGGPVRGEVGAREMSKVYPDPEAAKTFPKVVAVGLQRRFWFEILSKLPSDLTVKECFVCAVLTWPCDLTAADNWVFGIPTVGQGMMLIPV